MRAMILAAWRYRYFILSSVRNEFRARFARSTLGGVWMIIHPLMQVLMFALVLSAVLSAKLPGIGSRYSYAIYLTTGILSWSLFTELISRCMTIFVDNGTLLKKISFPRIALPLIVSGSVLLNNLLLLVAILAIFGVLGHFPNWQILWMPLLVGITLLLSLGLGLILGVLNVFIRDVGQIVPVLLQFGFWFTPIVYPVAIIPERFQPWFVLNPMFHLVTAYQKVLVFKVAPDWGGPLVIAGMSVVLLGAALLIFRRANAEMVDML